MNTKTYTIKVRGRFELIAPTGREISLSSPKVQALLAMLAVEPKMTRSRAWLQDKLWSDRDPQKGANSLRQALHKIRQGFGEDAEIIVSTRNTVSLDTRRVRLDDAGTTPSLCILIDKDSPSHQVRLTQSRCLAS